MAHNPLAQYTDRELFERADNQLGMMWAAQMNEFNEEYSELRKKALTDATRKP